MRTRIAWHQIVPAFVVVGTLWVTVAFRPTDSGVDVRVVPARMLQGAALTATKPGRRETLATARVAADGTVRFDLEPGRYEIRPPAGSGVARRQVLVRDERYAKLTIVARDGAS